MYFRSELFPIIVFQLLNQLIKCHGDRAQDDDGCNYHVELEEPNGGNDKSDIRKQRAISFGLDYNKNSNKETKFWQKSYWVGVLILLNYFCPYFKNEDM